MRSFVIFFILTPLLFISCQEGILVPEVGEEPEEVQEIMYIEATSAQFHRFLGAGAFFAGELNSSDLLLANETGYCFQFGSYACVDDEYRIYTSRIRNCNIPEFNPSFTLLSPQLMQDEINAFFDPGAKEFANTHTLLEADGFAIDMVYPVEEETSGGEWFIRLYEGSTRHGSQQDSRIEILKRERYMLTDMEDTPFVDLITIAFQCKIYDKEGGLIEEVKNGNALVRSPYYSIKQ